MTMGTILNIEEYINEVVDKKIQQALESIGVVEKKVEKKDYYTVPEVAQMVCLTAEHIYRVTKSGELGSFKIGRRVLVSHEQLERWCSTKRQYTKLERTEIAETYVATH